MARRKKTTDEQVPENTDNTDDTFGLPEVDYEPLKRDTPPEPEAVTPEPEPIIPEPEPLPQGDLQDTPPRFEEFEQQKFSDTEYEEERPAAWPKVLGILLLLAAIGAGVWYFGYEQPKLKAAAEKLAREKREADDARNRRVTDSLANVEAEAARLRAEAEKAAAKPAAGTIETLSGRTGRYYVVVASSIDGDLIMDFAKKLAAKGTGSKIIPPFGKTKFHRLAVAEADTYANAQGTADGMKGGDYGDKVWVVKY
jgi:type IV secretory pathway VirB10-like protein